MYTKPRNEIDDAVAVGAVSSPVQVAEAAKLPYLQACIREGLRVFPPIASLRERITPPEGDTIEGHSIPRGVNVGFNILGMQRSKVFGTDPDVFRPERWLHQDADRLHEMQMVHDLIFGHGATKCLGVKIAHLTLNKFFVEVRRISVCMHHFSRADECSFCVVLIFQVEPVSSVGNMVSPDLLCERAQGENYT